MRDIKNPFNFGTGNIDKDQWLKDIDNEQEGFITMYGSAANKHRTALLRQAFQDLRRRIASGDMLSRTADGQYQFGSALLNEDKHMQEAYQRALGFMGNLARKQINTPTAEPEKKKFEATTLEEAYKKHLFPGKFNERAYWDRDEAKRKQSLIDFLEGYTKDGALDSYQDFGDFESSDKLRARINQALEALRNGQEMDYNLGRLGFQGSWITKPVEEQEKPKSELEQVEADIAASKEAQQVQQGRQYLAFNGNRGQQEFNFTTPQFDLNYQLQHLLTTPQEMGGGPGFTTSGQSSDVLRRAATSRYIGNMQKELDNYFKNFATAWKPLYNNGEDSQRRIGEYLSKLFSTYSKSTNTDEAPVSDYAFNWKKYFTQIGQNQFLINGSIDNQTGRYAYYVPGEGIKEDNILDNPNQFVAQKLGYIIPSQKEGGKVEFLQSGGGFDYDAWAASQEKPKAQITNKPQQTSASKQENSSFSTAENARIAATIADIASMGAAFVPGYGTATSAILGLGSTATNFGADLADGQGLWNATKNAGFGLAADVMGLIPGLGGVGKGAKIARNLMWAVPKMMQWANTFDGISNIGEIKNSIMKLTSPSSMTVQDWQNVSQALQIMTGHGRSVATKAKKAGMSRTTTTTEPEYYIFTNKGKQKVSDETFKKLRETRGTKARQTLTQELMGEGVTLQQTRFAPWNTSTRFGAFKEVPGQTKVEIKNKHKGILSDENLVQKAENINPSVDIRNIIHKVNPYRAYYNNMTVKSGPLPNYLQRPVDVLPQGFGVTKSGMESAGFNMSPKPKRKPLTDEQKAARKQKADTKKKEAAQKKLEEMRRQQVFGMQEEVPQAASQAMARAQQVDRKNLSLRYANETEIPTMGPETQGNKFYRKYGNAVRKRKLGGTLKALRNGGIIKAQTGVKLNSGRDKTWYSDIFSNYEGNILSRLKSLEGQDRQKAIDWLNGMQDQHYALYRDRGDFNTTAQFDQRVKAYQEAYADGDGFIPLPSGFNIGIGANYNERYDFGGIPRTSGDHPTEFKNDGLYSAITDDRRVLGRTGDWSEENLNAFNAKLGELGYVMDNKYDDGYYRIKPLDGAAKAATNPNDTVLQQLQASAKPGDTGGKDGSAVVATETERDTIPTTKFKNPFDPTPVITGLKYAQGIAGNNAIYSNLLKEMPQAPLRDPVDRKLAIMGDQRVIDEARNKLGDLRRINSQQQGSDQQMNFATSLETERVGREIMDNAFRQDAVRQFDTAQKSWNIDNEDIMYNTQVSDANRKSIADRARMMAQIRAAWRSGNQNLAMGALSDMGNWMMKNYQTQMDTINKAREISLGSPEEYAQSQLYENDKKYAGIMDKYQSGQTLTPEEKAYVKTAQAKALRTIRQDYSKKYYDLYRTPWFGGGYSTVIYKDGSKLEVAKLKARGKDNDRYVSMIKDLRKTSYRRRRR